jgi:hypothetical protein
MAVGLVQAGCRVVITAAREAQEIGALAAFLAGSGGRYFTGQGIGPNGGSIMP